MRTKVVCAIFALALSFAPAGISQQAGDQDRREQLRERLESIQKRLEMTPEQSEKARPVVIEELREMKAARDKYGDSQDRRSRIQMAREFRGIQSSTDEKLKTILSKKQMDELQKIREERREEVRQRRNR